MIARVKLTQAALSALMCHTLAVGFDADVDHDASDETLWRCLNEDATELVFDPRDTDAVWSALCEVQNALGDDLHYRMSSDPKADRGALRALDALSRSVTSAGRAVAS